MDFEMLSTPYEFFLYWAIKPETMIAVWVPLWISLSVLFSDLYRKTTAKEFYYLFLATPIVGPWFCWWEEPGLHIFPVISLILYFLYLLYIHFKKQKALSWKAGFAMTYFSMLYVDTHFVLTKAEHIGHDTLELFTGIGGAGVADGLLWGPVIVALWIVTIKAYVHKRYGSEALAGTAVYA